MVMRKVFAPNYILPMLAVGCALLAAPDACAQTVTHAGAQFDGLLKLIQENSALWNGRLLGYAEKLFWALATIQLVMTFFPLALRQADIGEICHELVKYCLVIGFFYEILTRSTYWAGAVVQSFRDAGGIAIGQSSALQPSDVFMLAVKFANTIGDVSTLNPLVGVSIGLASVCVLLCFAFIAAFMAVTLIESYVVINASVLLLGFGGSQWTREYAMAMPRYAVAVGAKLFVLTLLVGLISQSATDWEKAYTHTDNASMWTMVGLAFTCAYLTKTIPDLIQGLIAGVSIGGGNTIGGMAAGAAAGAAFATGGVGGLAAETAGAAGSLGGAAASKGLAGLIDSAVTGGTNAAGAMGSSSGTSTAAAISPRVGGAGSAAKPMNRTAGTGAKPPVGRPSTGGGQANSAISTKNPSTAASSGSSDGADENGLGSNSGGPETASKTSSEAYDGTSTSSSETQPGQAASPSTPGTTPRQAAQMALSGAVQTAGVLASISVPGMESAHGISVGIPPALPGRSQDDRPNEADRENIIQPAKDKS